MKRSLTVFLPLLLSLIPLILFVGCVPPQPGPYIDCDVQALVDAINDANADPDSTTIELSPGCTYNVDEKYGDITATGLPSIQTEVIIKGNGATITRPPYVQGQTVIYRFFYVSDEGILTISDSTISGGVIVGIAAPGVGVLSTHGGAILNSGQLIIQDMTFENNRAIYGGAVAAAHRGTMSIQGSIFRGNLANLAGGAIHNHGDGTTQISGVLFDQNSSPGSMYNLGLGRGGAISNVGSDMTVADSIFTGNSALHSGGAITNTTNDIEIVRCAFVDNYSERRESVFFGGGNAAFINSTISRNHSDTVRLDSGTVRNNNGALSIIHSTITGNSGISPAIVSDNSNANISNSIITNNAGGDCDPVKTISASGNNIDSDGSCSGFITVDPLLEPLADNGGGTLTHALDPNSPAINLASGNCPGTDQRGVSRPYGNSCDLGAYEAETGESICDIQFLIDAIHDANADPDPTTIELTPGCIYVVDHAYADPHPIYGNVVTGLPLITSDVSIIGNGTTITRPAYQDNQQKYRLFFIDEGAHLSLSDVSLSNGYLNTMIVFNPFQGHGGAIFTIGDLELNNVNFTSNWAGGGGAVASWRDGSLEINGSRFWGNLSYIYGAAISSLGQGGTEIHDAVFSGNLARTQTYAGGSGRGAAIYASFDLVITDSLFEDNQAELSGGAIYVHNSPDTEINGCTFVNNWAEDESSVLEAGDSNVAIINSTFSGNTSDGCEKSAIHNEGGSLSIGFSTIVDNHGNCPAIFSDNTGISILNSIIANNQGGDCDANMVLATSENNLDSDSSCGGIIAGDPLLAPLADNGGGLPTHALDPASPAIDVASGACPATDQRGVNRPQSFFCDLGAYEAEEVETCSINYLVNAIHFANSDPDPTTIELDPGCTYIVDQQYGDRQSGLPQLTTDITILGNWATISRPSLDIQPDEFRFFYIEYGTPVSISDLTLSSGAITGAEGVNDDSDSHGGAIFNRGDLTLTGVTFQHNRALYGGALANDDRGSLSAGNLVFQNNQALYDGGALYLGGNRGAVISQTLFESNRTQGEGSGGRGGAIFNQFDLELSSSTLAANDSSQGGGGIFNLGETQITGCTLLRNSASEAGGSALQNQSGTLTLLNSTLSGNQAGPGNLYTIFNGGGLIRISYSTVTAAEGGAAALGGGSNLDSYRYDVINSIIASNPPGDCDPSIPISVYGNNLDSDGSCQGFTHTADPLLQPLPDIGPPTWTHAITMDSPALNAASGECPITDQRGVTRPQGVACDLGAYEYDGIQPTPSPTPELDPCLYEALVNASCRESDYPESGFIATLAQGEMALLLGINPEGTHGLFDISGYDPCWILFSLLSGMDPGACDPPCYDPPPRPSLLCQADLEEAECVEAGGIYHPGFAAPPWCECP